MTDDPGADAALDSLAADLHRVRCEDAVRAGDRPSFITESWQDRPESLKARDRAMVLAVTGALRERAEAAEAKLERVTKLAETWAALAPVNDWGLTPGDTVAADAGRAILAIISGETVPGDD